jgi:glycosyltransferase 2 family protein
MIFGLIVFFLYLYFFVGFNKVFLVIQSFNPSEYLLFYSLAIGTMLLVMFFWVLAWRTILRIMSVKISLKNAYMYYWAGYFIDLIVPCQAVCGELTRLYLVQKETDNNYGVLGAAGIANRIVAYSVVTTGLTVGLLFVLTGRNVPSFALDLMILAWIGAIAFLSGMLYLALSENAAEKIASLLVKLFKTLHVKKYRAGQIPPETLESLQNFHSSFRVFRTHPRHLILPYFFHSISYVLSMTVYVLAFYALGFNSSFAFIVVVYFLTGAIQDAAAAFSVGSLEILLTNIFIFYGFSAALSGVAAGVLRSLTFWFPLVVGYIIIQWVGAKKLLTPVNPTKNDNKIERTETFAEAK